MLLQVLKCYFFIISQGFNPLHLACRGGHSTVVGLLLSRSAELLESKDASGKSGLHIAAIHGHKQMVEVLLGQGAEIDAIDKVYTGFLMNTFIERFNHCHSKMHFIAFLGIVDAVNLCIKSGSFGSGKVVGRKWRFSTCKNF